MTDRLSLGEAGYTLPELLMTIAIMAIITIPLGNSMFLGLKNTDRTAKVLAGSSDRQMASVYLPPDIKSATNVDTTDAGSRCPSDEGTRVVRMSWREVNEGAPTTTYVADYRFVAGTTEGQVIRFSCTVGATDRLRLPIAHHLQAAPAVNPDAPVSVTFTDTLGETFTISGSRRV